MNSSFPSSNSHHFQTVATSKTFLVKLTDTFLRPESQSVMYRQVRFTGTGYLHTVYFHCEHCTLFKEWIPTS